MLENLKNNLIVSCQPVVGGPMDSPAIIAAMAKASVAGGAAGVRVEGVANVAAARAAVACPIIGIVKVALETSAVKITPFAQNVVDLISAGADIVAVDATDRDRPETIGSAIEITKQHGGLFMADCSNLKDGVNAQRLGADILGTTMSGYTERTTPEEPDLELVGEFSRLGTFVIAEGRYNTPDLAARAIRSGADAVVVGSAITRLEVVTRWFRDAVDEAGVKR
ncbi:N-acylglucosamine-6-phosphate 2-epimerase [Labrenzia sp. EL_208]|uniref:N-acetylmannosamine-6-phosphate 2-epimerase n=1 Tax=Roseibium album TaxID=311410 RepID=UPI0018C97EBF|nr:putative N-acetylmannosamine-6-phosphate 2-epimerase [Roseibium album]MBG6142564.1 N-acylglucosamine-6-phosphate 2-epimerase [Labrenzia sp. EL_142]MBG6159210.1 N-acylglucosamine-6-phosphate 2-epimerase [Labrenzia sp. EL_162]MBG6177574.1 N-acylglucosamine-6-phosphate 2-epimerase [Labrenzia sp. EL_132]MBG6197702.1 N-acylglucosamine-6-phosphate 2-epimerase [Labrenzia sp. EL_159]MBG6232346.1 N-acylglucosamine-6-phosphate 2-epimerase [Labrenzia sp. EL_208]